MHLKTICLILITGISSIVMNGQSYNTLLEHAEELEAEYNYQGAIEIYTQLFDSNPDSISLLRQRAYLLLATEQFEACKQDYMSYLSKDPNCSNSYSNLARIEAVHGNINECQIYLDKAYELDKENPYFFVNRADIARSYPQIGNAMSDYNTVIRLEPKNAQWREIRAQYYFERGMNILAKSDAEKAIELDPESFNAHYLLTRYYTTQEDWPEALSWINKAIGLTECEGLLHQTRGTIYFRMGELEKSVESYLKAIECDPNESTFHYDLSLTHYALEDMDATCEDYDNTLRLMREQQADAQRIEEIEWQQNSLCNPKLESYYFQRGIADYNLGDYDSAIQHYTEGFEKFPRSPYLFSFRGNALLALGKYEQAKSNFEQGLANINNAEPSTAELMSRNSGNEASTVLKFLQNDMNASIAECHLQQGNTALALEYIDKAIAAVAEYANRQNGKDVLASSYQARGIFNSAVGNIKEMHNDFQRAMNYNGNMPQIYASYAMAMLVAEESIEVERVSTITLMIDNANIASVKKAQPISARGNLSKEKLNEIIEYCGYAITISPDYAFAYMLRGKAKFLAEDPNYCTDIMHAVALGIEEAETIIDVKCR